MRSPLLPLRPGPSAWALFTLTLALAACNPSPATTPPPAATQVPTLAVETPVPPTPTVVVPATVTPAPPTATPEPTATETATPDVAATPDPNLGVGATLYEDRFDGARWGWTFQDDVVKFGIENAQLNAVMTRPDAGWRISMGPDVIAGDQQLQLTVRANLCYERDEYGLLFRNTTSSGDAPRFNGYVFKLNCAGQARVELFRDSQPSVLLDWTASPAIQAGAPAENVLLVWAAQDQFHFYVNGKHLGSLTDGAFAEGDFGVYLRDRTNGGISVSFTALTVKEVKLP